MFSIIIPLYNKATYIEKAIKSVLSQTFQEFEIIVVNDGSTDDSLNHLQFIINNLQYKEPEAYKKIRIINQENQGVSVARNNGVKLAKYEYIAFLDADDWWEPGYLEEMKGLIDTISEAGIFGCCYNIINKNKNRIAKIGVENKFKEGIINYCQVYAKTGEMPLWTGATIIKKSIFESEHGFKPAMKLGEDFDLWVRVAINYPVAFLNKPLSNYNQDVELTHRAIGEKQYKPEEHMLFTDYGSLQKNKDFRKLFEVLALYGLLPYYLTGKNKKEVDELLSGIHWGNHPFKYRLFYRILPKEIVKLWLRFKKFGFMLKNKVAF